MIFSKETAMHKHDDGQLHRPFKQYALAISCPRCGAAEGQPCTMLGGRFSWHERRDRKATTWRSRDVMNTPWLEDREPGACYSTLPGCE
jgi:hypothetical protein